MRSLFYAPAFLAMVLLSLAGCSERSVSPVTPNDESISQSGSLEKHVYRELTGSMDPIEETDPGTTKEVNGKIIFMGMHNRIAVSAAFSDGGTDLFSGEGDLELNGIVDFSAGTSFWWGKLKLTPAAPETLGGYWTLVYHGKGTLGPTGWTISLKEGGPGKGGALTGLHVLMDNIITAPPDLSVWHGEFHGLIKSHGGNH